MLHTIHHANWQDHQADLIKIRAEVFMLEQDVSAADEWDGLDEQALHFLVLSPTNDALGCARMLHEVINGKPFCHVGRVAILKPFRGLGLGHELIAFIIKHCKKAAPESGIYLHAQTDRRSFYEALGFVAEGEVFMDAGIPHISMTLMQKET
ncbi:MAG: GNAT family N-acetyltransferase [Cellvibrio sp.]|uniref:GNAT family N-acetyltransferase n=1 Tax=Cellvibrio sp. TaxID=1965322 RepID=UPI0031AA99A9